VRAAHYYATVVSLPSENNVTKLGDLRELLENISIFLGEATYVMVGMLNLEENMDETIAAKRLLAKAAKDGKKKQMQP
jgi:hypothetical protein